MGFPSSMVDYGLEIPARREGKIKKELEAFSSPGGYALEAAHTFPCLELRYKVRLDSAQLFTQLNVYLAFHITAETMVISFCLRSTLGVPSGHQTSVPTHFSCKERIHPLPRSGDP